MIIDRYLTRETATTFVAVCAVLIIIFLTYSLGRFLTDAAAGLLNADEVVELTVLKAVIALEVLLPIGLYFGLIIGMGNLHVNSELIALQSCGISERRLHGPVLRFTLLLTLLVAVTSLIVRPWAYSRTYAVEATAEASSDISRIKPGEFYLYEDENRVVFVDQIGKDGQALKGIFVRTRKQGDVEAIASGQGRLESFVTPDRHRLTLSDAQIFKQVEDGPNFTGTFGKLTFTIGARAPEDTSYKSKAKNSSELLRSTTPEDSAELQWRLSTPVSTLLLALMALRLSRGRPREGRFTKLPLALAIYAVYFNLLGVSRNWVEQETFATIWWVPGLLVALLIAAAVPWRRPKSRAAET
jgi:lipopolysaccharide export system permease protein